MKKLAYLVCILGLTACGKGGAPAAPVSALDTAARRTCMDTIESRAINRNSVAYNTEDATPVAHHGASGQLEVLIKFSAKNEIGMATSMLARCMVSQDGKKLIDITVKDSR